MEKTLKPKQFLILISGVIMIFSIGYLYSKVKTLEKSNVLIEVPYPFKGFNVPHCINFLSFNGMDVETDKYIRCNKILASLEKPLDNNTQFGFYETVRLLISTNLFAVSGVLTLDEIEDRKILKKKNKQLEEHYYSTNSYFEKSRIEELDFFDMNLMIIILLVGQLRQLAIVFPPATHLLKDRTPCMFKSKIILGVGLIQLHFQL